MRLDQPTGRFGLPQQTEPCPHHTFLFPETILTFTIHHAIHPLTDIYPCDIQWRQKDIGTLPEYPILSGHSGIPLSVRHATGDIPRADHAAADTDDQ